MAKFRKPLASSAGTRQAAHIPKVDDDTCDRAPSGDTDSSAPAAEPEAVPVIPQGQPETTPAAAAAHVVYARFSSGAVDPVAVDHQIAAAATLGNARGPVVHLYRDEAASVGSSGNGVSSRAFASLYAEQARETFLARAAAGRRAAYDAGRIPHRPAYGYEVEPGKAGCHRKAPEAAVVAEIFELVRAGRTPLDIANELSRRQPAPGAVGSRDLEAAAPWSAEAVRRIVRSPLYAGLVVYGRTSTRRDALSGEASREVRPPVEWKSVFAPHLQIVADDLWIAANAKIDERGATGGKARRLGLLLKSVARFKKG